MRNRITALFATLVLTGTIVAANSAPATAVSEPPTHAKVTRVAVNRTGGITASGTIDCGRAVADHFGGAIPADVSVVAHIDWEATQPLGRRSILHASYSQTGFQWGCFNNNADGDHGPVCGTGTDGGACPWMTSRDGATSWWVYASNGRFAPGPVHIELAVNGFEPNGIVIVDGAPVPITVDVGIPPLAFDLRAQRG